LIVNKNNNYNIENEKNEAEFDNEILLFKNSKKNINIS
jgi:hypothetical protein